MVKAAWAEGPVTLHPQESVPRRPGSPLRSQSARPHWGHWLGPRKWAWPLEAPHCRSIRSGQASDRTARPPSGGRGSCTPSLQSPQVSPVPGGFHQGCLKAETEGGGGVALSGGCANLSVFLRLVRSVSAVASSGAFITGQGPDQAEELRFCKISHNRASLKQGQKLKAVLLPLFYAQLAALFCSLGFQRFSWEWLYRQVCEQDSHRP